MYASSSGNKEELPADHRPSRQGYVDPTSLPYKNMPKEQLKALQHQEALRKAKEEEEIKRENDPKTRYTKKSYYQLINHPLLKDHGIQKFKNELPKTEFELFEPDIKQMPRAAPLHNYSYADNEVDDSVLDTLGPHHRRVKELQKGGYSSRSLQYYDTPPTSSPEEPYKIHELWSKRVGTSKIWLDSIAASSISTLIALPIKNARQEFGITYETPIVQRIMKYASKFPKWVIRDGLAGLYKHMRYEIWKVPSMILDVAIVKMFQQQIETNFFFIDKKDKQNNISMPFILKFLITMPAVMSQFKLFYPFYKVAKQKEKTSQFNNFSYQREVYKIARQNIKNWGGIGEDICFYVPFLLRRTTQLALTDHVVDYIRYYYGNTSFWYKFAAAYSSTVVSRILVAPFDQVAEAFASKPYTIKLGLDETRKLFSEKSLSQIFGHNIKEKFVLSRGAIALSIFYHWQDSKLQLPKEHK